MYALLAALKGELFRPGTPAWLGSTPREPPVLGRMAEHEGPQRRAARRLERVLAHDAGMGALRAAACDRRHGRRPDRGHRAAAGRDRLRASGWPCSRCGCSSGAARRSRPSTCCPLLPLLALSLALVLGRSRAALARRFGRGVSPPAVGLAAAAALVLLVVAYQRSEQELWTADPVAGQSEAVSWIRHDVPPSSRIIIDDYLWNALHVPPAGDPGLQGRAVLLGGRRGPESRAPRLQRQLAHGQLRRHHAADARGRRTAGFPDRHARPRSLPNGRPLQHGRLACGNPPCGTEHGLHRPRSPAPDGTLMHDVGLSARPTARLGCRFAGTLGSCAIAARRPAAQRRRHRDRPVVPPDRQCSGRSRETPRATRPRTPSTLTPSAEPQMSHASTAKTAGPPPGPAPTRPATPGSRPMGARRRMAGRADLGGPAA